MFYKKKILAIIPARMGSKRIKNKNIKKINGIPLINYTLNNLNNSKLVDYVLLSSDSKKILDCGKKFDFVNINLRPKKYSKDNSLITELLIYLINLLEKKNLVFDYVCLLQPTSPLRYKNEIDFSIKKIIKENADSLISLTKLKEPHPYKLYKLNNNKLDFFKNYKYNISPRQQLPDLYMAAGNIYIFKTNILKKKKNIFGKKISYYMINENRYLNIDNPKDILKANTKLVKKNINTQKP